MAQHNDLIIDDQTGSDFLPDINSILMAILTQNSGNDEPPATVPFMYWAEPDTDTLWQRNAANDGWVNKGGLSTALGVLASKNTVSTAEIDDGAVTSAKLSPSISLASTDQVARKSIALLQFNQMAQNNYTLQNKDDGVTDVFADESGVDTGASTNQSYSAAGDYYEGIGPVGTDAIPTMTGASAPSGTASASSEYDASYSAWKAFDNNSTNDFVSLANDIPGWIEYDFGIATAIGGYTVTGPPAANLTRAPKDFKLQGWNGSSWVDLDTQTNVTGWTDKQKRSYTLIGSANYAKYRLYITSLNGDVYLHINEFELLAAGDAVNMTIQSAAFAADTVPTEMDLFIWQEDIDAITLNTDLKAYVSRDNGATWTQGTLVEEFSAPVGRILSALDVDISAQPSGTSVKWKIETLNTKAQRIRGVDLQWS
ncbi:hypothetical protein WH95_18610 [Kiloniella litopenaei]|uniref:F5/8 type C domain-containing protein n=1 Tax=Kiloniella litopenaei TaxID=1549748 RepID=A0A0M2R7E2_9PROT|nr:discoidin domain-containing protein [Kiloniella litopenaei]KKJ75453.1 hypothetical protein WH95_18610 [Kiloniella litopenaei]